MPDWRGREEGNCQERQTQREMDRKLQTVNDQFYDLFTDLGKAKVKPVHIEVDTQG